MMQHNYHLQRRVQDLKEEYEHWEPWLDEYSIITLEIGRLSFPTNVAILMHQFRCLHNKIIKETALAREYKESECT